LFPLLGLFAWWIFASVSLPPSLRDLWKEDDAIASAATPASEEERAATELAKLPLPSQQHAPEVAALLQRLQNLPSLPYVLSQALAREAAAPAGQQTLPWTEEEKSALEEVQRSYLGAWAPFFQGPAPDWSNYPDSILLFRSSLFLLSLDEQRVRLLTYRPGQKAQPRFLAEVRELPELMLPLLRQCRNLGSIRFGGLAWEISETVRTAALTAEGIGGLISNPEYSPNILQIFLANLAPAPALSDLRAGLAADRSLFSRTAEYLESLPASTPAHLALERLLRGEKDNTGYLETAEGAGTAAQLAAQLRREAEQLDVLRQKTFLTGPAWRQWLTAEPGRELGPLLAQGLGGFREFEDVRMKYLVARAGLEARIAWQSNGPIAARRIADPARPGSFLKLEESPQGIRLTSAHIPLGQAEPVSYFIPLAVEGER